VVLGATGRNFAAGMSGGEAFVLDVDGGFASRVNYEMVDIVELTPADDEWLRNRIALHVTETGSPLGSKIVADWSRWQPKFCKVMPRDYARVMKVLEDARASGESETETWQRVMASQHG
jgi:glutamate synthase (NADPH/NADH) large chain